MSTTYVATVTLTVRDPKTGRSKTYAKGDRVSAAVWAGLSASSRSRFEVAPKAARRPRGTAAARPEVQVADAALLETFLLAEAEGYVFEGGYADVWAEVVDAVGVPAPFAHFRALQLARVGRRFETLTGVSFAALCPGLPVVAADWVSALA